MITTGKICPLPDYSGELTTVVGKSEMAHVNLGVATCKMLHWQVRGQVWCDVETNYGKVNKQSRNKSSALQREGIGPSQLQADLIACHP